jgi:hypothetical protein
MWDLMHLIKLLPILSIQRVLVHWWSLKSSLNDPVEAQQFKHFDGHFIKSISVASWQPALLYIIYYLTALILLSLFKILYFLWTNAFGDDEVARRFNLHEHV